MRTTVLLLSLACLFLVGCSGPRQVNLPVRGVAPLNPNDAQESTPVDVRVWPLAAPDRFRSATVDQLWTDAKGVLGSDLLGEFRVFTVFPGGSGDPVVEQRIEVPGSTAFLGVLAMCQRSDAQDQRATVVAIDEAEKLGLILTGFSVQLVTPATP